MKNKSRKSIKTSLALAFFLFLFSFSFISAEIVIVKPSTGTITNDSLLNVNSSDYWDDLDTPLDISGSEYWYNQSTATYNMYNGQWSSTYNFSYVPYTGATNDIDLNSKSLVTLGNINTSKIQLNNTGGSIYISSISNGASYDNLDIQPLILNTANQYNFFTASGDGGDDNLLTVWGYGNRPNGVTDRHRLFLGWDNSESAYTINTEHAGTQAEKKIIMYANDADTNQFILNTDGDVNIQTSTSIGTLNVGGFVSASSGYYMGDTYNSITYYGMASGLQFSGYQGYFSFQSIIPHQDIKMIFPGTDNSGEFDWMEDEDRFEFKNDVKIVGNLNVTAGFTGTCINVTYSGGIAVACND